MSTSEMWGDVGISQVGSGQGADKEYASEAACKDGGSVRLAARGSLGGAEGRLEERLAGTELNGGRGEDAQVHVRVECRRDGEEVSVAKGNQRGHGHVTWRDRLPVHDARAGGLKEERVVGREDGGGGAAAGAGVVTRKWSSPVGSRTGLSHSLPRSLTPCPSLFPSSPSLLSSRAHALSLARARSLSFCFCLCLFLSLSLFPSLPLSLCSSPYHTTAGLCFRCV